jgi:uncharacterized protein (DUF1810 family)
MNHTNQGLERFVEAQAAVYHTVVTELAMGHKETHWMWFIFPQLKELGKSAMATRYGIASANEARAYLAHPVLGSRLVECCKLLLTQRNANAFEIFGSPDELKLRSCMTLFALTSPQETVFKEVVGVFFNGKFDEVTVKLLALPGTK